MPPVNTNIAADGTFKAAISHSTRKALVDFWGSEEIIEQPELIVELGADGVSRISRIGRKSLAEIAVALHAFGYIASAPHWLARTRKQEPSL